MDGEDYGRGHVEEHRGDLETPQKSSPKAIAGRNHSVRSGSLSGPPHSNTDPKDLEEAENLAIISGHRDDVTTLQVEKAADLRVALETCAMIVARLEQAFLLSTSVQRNAERVTAEEIRVVASELEDALGGVYSVLSQEFQYPLVRCLMHHLQKKRRLPHLPEKHVKPFITTGMEALGRGHDLNRLMTFGQIVQNTLGPEGFKRDPSHGVHQPRNQPRCQHERSCEIPTRGHGRARRKPKPPKMQALGPSHIQAAGRIEQERMKNEKSK